MKVHDTLDAEGGSGLGLGQIFTMTVGTIIGIGWITMLGFWLEQAGSVGAMLAFIGGALLILPIALCYAEMAASIPETGGEIAYARAVAGRRGGFWAGWLLLLTFVAVMAFEAVSTGWVLGALFPGLGLDRVAQVFGRDVRPGEIAVGLAGMAIIAAVNLRGDRSFGRLQDVTTYGKLVVSAVFVFAGLAWGNPQNLNPTFVGASREAGMAGVLAVLVTTPFWFSGFNAAAQAVGERSRHTPLRGIGPTLAGAILVSLLFYCLVIAAASMAAPRAEILGHSLPVAGAFESTFGPTFAKFVLIAGLLGLVSTWNAVFFAATRVFVALAEDGGLPIWFARRSRRTNTPVNAMLICVLLGSCGALLGRPVIGPVVNSTGTCVAALFLLVCVALVVLRRRRPDLERPYRVPGGQVTASFAGISSAVLVVLSLYLPYADAGRAPAEWWILGVWLALGAVLLLARRAILGSR